MAGHSDATPRRRAARAAGRAARQVEQVNRDLLAERLGRVEDLELMVDLISTGMAAMRQDMAALARWSSGWAAASRACWTGSTSRCR